MERPGLAARIGLLAGLAALACRREEPPQMPEVRVHASVSPLASEALAASARLRGIARVRLVAGGPAAAEVAWFGDPTEAVEAQELLAAGAAPSPADVDARWKDPRGRFAPVCARARVLVRARRERIPMAPVDYRDLADPRLAGLAALAEPSSGAGPVTLAALAAVHGEQGVERFLLLLARNRPRVAESDDEVRLLVAAGAAAVGLTGSEEAAAAAASAASLEIVYPDQGGRGAIVLPTAAALTRRGAASGAARRLLAWMAGPEADALLVARDPGLMPLRPDVPVPVGVKPAGAVRALTLDWDDLAAAKRRLAPRLARWPEP